MGNDGRNCAAVAVGAVILALSGCAEPQHTNIDHPDYGPAEYQKDLTDCRRANTRWVPIGGYNDATRVIEDQDGIKACMAGRGWRQASR